MRNSPAEFTASLWCSRRFAPGRICYDAAMTRLLQKAFEQARQLPDEEQDAAAGALLDYLDHMRDLRLTDEQVAAVRRRLAEPERRKLALDEVRNRLRQLGE